jgi:hypothetical protein
MPLASQALLDQVRKELAAGLRRLSIGRYFTCYMPVHDGVDAVRVLQGTRDVDAAFGGVR